VGLSQIRISCSGVALPAGQVSAAQLDECTEGSSGYIGEQGGLYLNQNIELEWLDHERLRFVPVVTDFSCTIQQVVRYRSNDMQPMREQRSSNGRSRQVLAAVEGCNDDVLWLRSADPTQVLPLFPEMVRHAISSTTLALPDYRIEQHGAELRIAVADGSGYSRRAMGDAICLLALRHGLRPPQCTAMPFVQGAPDSKRRRILCVQPEQALEWNEAHG
jgi:hypothetical protein